MNTYFDVGDQRFESREEAIEQIEQWKSAPVFMVHEVENTQVTRKTAKGDIITETVRGSLERVPRIISLQKLGPTYVVADSAVCSADVGSNRPWNRLTHFGSRAEAEQDRVKRQGEADKLAALTEADIKELHVPTLDEILERDADKIKALEAEIKKRGENWEQLKKQTEASIAAEVANLENQIATLKAGAHFGLPQAKEQYRAAVQAYNKAIHLDELEAEVIEKMVEEHGQGDCWPDSDCRSECSFEENLGDAEIEEYLLEHAEEFEVEAEGQSSGDAAALHDLRAVLASPEMTVRVTTDAEKLWRCAEIQRKHCEHVGQLPLTAGQPIRVYSQPVTPDFCDAKSAWVIVRGQAEHQATSPAKQESGDPYVLCDHQIDFEEAA